MKFKNYFSSQTKREKSVGDKCSYTYFLLVLWVSIIHSNPFHAYFGRWNNIGDFDANLRHFRGNSESKNKNSKRGINVVLPWSRLLSFDLFGNLISPMTLFMLNIHSKLHELPNKRKFAPFRVLMNKIWLWELKLTMQPMMSIEAVLLRSWGGPKGCRQTSRHSKDMHRCLECGFLTFLLF